MPSGNADNPREQQRQQAKRLVEELVSRRAGEEGLSGDSLIEAHPELMPELGEELAKLRRIDKARAMAEEGVPDEIKYFGSYIIVRQLGHGAMGDVFLAQQITPARRVAVKTIRGDVKPTPNQIARFHIEANAAASLADPNIVPLYEVGQHNGQLFYSMGYLDGESLYDKTKRNPLPNDDAARYVRKIAKAVHYAHTQKVIHRDIKPGNILVDRRRDEPHLADFGLAKQLVVKPGGQLTDDGQGMGTPGYMPPEQILAIADQIGPRSDVFALGATLYSLLIGRPPWQGATSSETMLQTLQNEPVPPRQINPSIDLDLETICLKCLEKDPAKRYQTADDLSAELTRYAEGRPIEARPVSRMEHAWRWCKRNPLAAGLTAAVVFALLTGTIISSHFAMEMGKQRDNAIAAEGRANEEAAAAVLAKKDAEKQARIAEAERDRADKKAKEAEAERDRADRKAEEADVERGKALGALKNEAAQRKKAEEATTEAKKQTRIAKAASERADKKAEEANAERGKSQEALKNEAAQRKRAEEATKSAVRSLYHANIRLAESKLQHRDANGAATALAACPHEERSWEWSYLDHLLHCELQSIELGSRVKCLAVSRDGRWIAATINGIITIVNVATGQETLWLQGHSDSVTCVAFSPDGRRLVSGSLDKTVKLWDAETGKEMLTFKGHYREGRSGYVLDVAFSPDGAYVASAGQAPNHHGDLRVWNAKNGEELFAVTDTAAIFAVAFSPDGRRLVTGGVAGSDFEKGEDAERKPWYDGMVRIWNTSTGKQERMLKGHGALVASVAFSPDGRSIVSGSSDKTIRIWNADSGEETLLLKGHKGEVHYVGFSDDGQRIVSGGTDNEIAVWDAATGRENLLVGRHESVSLVAFTANDKRIVSAGGGGIKIWDPTACEALTLRKGPEETTSLAFSSDHRLLASGGNDGNFTIWDFRTGKSLRSIRAHAGGVVDVAFSPDSRWAVSGSQEDTVARVWDLGSGKNLFSLEGHERGVLCVAFSPDGRHIVTGDTDDVARVWDCEARKRQFSVFHGIPVEVDPEETSEPSDSEEPPFTLAPHSPRFGSSEVKSVCFSPDGRRILLGGEDRLELRDARTGRRLSSLNLNDSYIISTPGSYYTASAFSPDGKYLVVGDYSRIRLFSSSFPSRSLSPLQTLSDFSAETSADGRLASQRKTNEESSPVFSAHCPKVQSVTFTPDGRRIVSGHSDGTTRIWNASTGDELLMLTGEGNGPGCVGVSPDGRFIASSGGAKQSPGDIAVWSTTRGSETLSLPCRAKCIAFTPDDRDILTIGLSDGLDFGVPGPILAKEEENACVWNARTGEKTLEVAYEGLPPFGMRCEQFSPDGRYMAIGGRIDSVSPLVDDSSSSLTPKQNSQPNTVTIYDVRTGAKILSLKGNLGGVQCVAFCPDARLLVSGGPDSAVRVWDLKTGRETFVLKGHAGSVRCATFSPDGQRIATVASRAKDSYDKGSEIIVWNMETSAKICTISRPGEIISTLTFSPDGKHILTGGCVLESLPPDFFGEVQVFAPPGFLDSETNTATPDYSELEQRSSEKESQTTLPFELIPVPKDALEEVPFDGPETARPRDAVSLVHADPVADRRLGHVMRLWDAVTGRELLAFRGHTREVKSVQFSKDGQRIVSGSLDDTVKIWSASTGREIVSFRGRLHGVLQVVFSSDGKRVVGRGPKAVRVWDMEMPLSREPSKQSKRTATPTSAKKSNSQPAGLEGSVQPDAQSR